MKTKIGNDWNGVLKDEFEKEYFEKLTDFVKTEYKSEVCFPPVKDIFNAFEMCSFSNTKIVILGQDPYHGKGQAHGLSFSVPEGMKIPPSLRNIFKELASDLGVDSPTQGDLTSWAKQGVLLLNATLTVRKSKPVSHQKQGWEEFTDSVIKTISNKKESVVIVLWGKFAEQKVSLIDESKHCIITSSHPSPFSAHRGFLGSKPFSKTNEFLEKKGIEKIDWELKNDQVKMEF
ncbi:MAG: uracil-DNA glycosylase [Flavobacteriales bacterium]|jgi:uracil-DNA glycosylase|tara:strand:- start:8570 stop:9265 length:696 start_codon:yes stop_codon:yes gene_type:complete